MLSSSAAVLVSRLAEDAETSDVGPGIVAFTIVVLLAVATFFLIRSMLHHIGKVPPSFEEQSEKQHDGQKAPSEDQGNESPPAGGQ